MNQGDIAFLPIPTANGTAKGRPVLLLKQMPPYNDWLVCGISTQLHQEVKGFDMVIQDSDPQFSQTGLKAASLIRLGYLSLVPKKNIPGVIGKTDQNSLRTLLQRLANHLLK